MTVKDYFGNIGSAVGSSWQGLVLSMRYLLQVLGPKRAHDVTRPGYFGHDRGTFTVQFPHETIPVPEIGRYKLHNELDDCIVCDKCAKACPVDCIEIEPVRAVEAFGETSDGTPKRIYAARFDIDMSKCMFCGLCTVVCPTECLTMTPEYDFSTFDVREHTFAFADMTPEQIAIKKTAWETHLQSKQAVKPVMPPAATSGGGEAPKPAAAKPVFRPRPIPPKPKTE
jgi:formate hydrogenlyase subunit 6/NADH:ubiquinone oxidoreductase subunit I